MCAHKFGPVKLYCFSLNLISPIKSSWKCLICLNLPDSYATWKDWTTIAAWPLQNLIEPCWILLNLVEAQKTWLQIQFRQDTGKKDFVSSYWLIAALETFQAFTTVVLGNAGSSAQTPFRPLDPNSAASARETLPGTLDGKNRGTPLLPKQLKPF